MSNTITFGMPLSAVSDAAALWNPQALTTTGKDRGGDARPRGVPH